jgi:6-phosphogluconolactonase (cycloisomerase 2 family)
MSIRAAVACLGTVVALATAAPSLAAMPTPLGCIKDPHADSSFQSCARSAPGLNGAIGAVVSPDSRNLYVTSELAGEITTFNRDATNGNIDQVACFKPSSWTSTLNKPSACTQTARGINGAIGVASSPDGKSIYVAGVNDSAVVAFSRDAVTGKLTDIGCIQKVGAASDVCSTKGEGLGAARAVAVSPDGRNVYVGTLGHSLAEFSRDPVSGTLRQLPAPDNCIEDPADNNPTSGIINGTGKQNCTKTASGLAYVRTVTVSPDGRNVYAATDYGQAISQFARDPGSGALTPLGCVADERGPGYTSCESEIEGLGWAWGIVVSPDGRFAYSSAYGIINVFSRDGDGRLQKIGCVSEYAPTGGCASADGIIDAVDLTLSPDGDTLYAAAFRQGAFAIFSRDAASGMLTQEGCVQNVKLPYGDDPHCSIKTDGIYQPRVVAPSPDGRSLYVPTSVGSDIASFSLPVRETPPPPAAPRAVPPESSPAATSISISVARTRRISKHGAASSARRRTAASRQRMRVLGTVHGARSGKAVLEFERRVKKRWVRSRRIAATLGKGGRFSSRVRKLRRGKWRVRALYAGDSSTRPSTSRYRRFVSIA